MTYCIIFVKVHPKISFTETRYFYRNLTNRFYFYNNISAISMTDTTPIGEINALRILFISTPSKQAAKGGRGRAAGSLRVR